MALYKDRDFVRTSDSSEFDKLYSPGAACPHSGIYRCDSCGDEIASNKGNPFPPQNHHQHKPGAGAIRWRMIVYAEQKK